ncbi:MAG TPA: PAS domain S-box protein [Candidatus Acidoferrum sp.]|jgi:PAS domain S-box-containing protein|nr:PAS domain S-box protein [Candidatus Acidoferrum sp.]
MNSSPHPSFQSVHVQLLITIFLAVLLWALYQRLRKLEFFRWWAWAWTCSAVFLAAAIELVKVGPDWTPLKISLLVVVLVFGMMQSLLLALGGLSWRVPERSLGKIFRTGLWLTLALSAMAFWVGYVLRAHRDVSFAARNLPRTLTMMAALTYCCIVFFGQWLRKGSWAALMSAAFCMFYAIDQVSYTIDFVGILRKYFGNGTEITPNPIDYVQTLLGSPLFFLDLVHICGICLGMILLLVEQSQSAERNLEVSERRRRGLAVNNVELQAEIDERQRAELALRASEERVLQILQGSPVAIVVSRVSDQRIELTNRKYFELFGYAPEEVPDVEHWWPLAYPDPDYRKAIQEQWRALVNRANRAHGESQSMSARVRSKDGSMREIEFYLSRVGDSYLVSFVDLTAHKLSDDALRESEAKFRLVAETAPCAIWILQGERLVYVNRYAESLSGYSREELFSMNPWVLVDPEFRAMGEQRSNARLRGENPEPRYQFKILTKSGEIRWLDFSGARTNFEGKPAILATAFDITATKRAEQQLLERTMYLDALIANSPLGIVTKDEQNRVVFCNPAFERMFHYSQNELQGKDIDNIIASHDLEDASRLTFAIRGGGVVHATTQRLRRDGTLIDVELHGIRVFSGETFVGAFAIYQDITERRRSEEKLQALRNRLTRTQEEERSRIARDLHDDIGQRLALLSIDLEQMKRSSQEAGSDLARELEALVRTASEITSDVHNVSRRLHPSQVELLGLAPALNNFCREFANRNSMRIQFTSACLTGKVPEEASLCLFRVAQEAIRNVHKHSGCREAFVELDEISGSLRLRISDRGSGFDPTSAEASQGLGLLSMEERLRSIGGELFVHSRAGGGTCIEASIPATQNVTV